MILVASILIKSKLNKKITIKDEIITKYKNAPFRAPMIIILVSTFKDHPKVPGIEQKLSTAASAQNILLSLSALGYSAI